MFWLAKNVKENEGQGGESPHQNTLATRKFGEKQEHGIWGTKLVESEYVIKVKRSLRSGARHPMQEYPAGWWPVSVGIGAVADAHLNFNPKTCWKKSYSSRWGKMGRMKWEKIVEGLETEINWLPYKCIWIVYV